MELGSASPRRLAVVLPLRPGSHEAVRRLLAQGPPFDPEQMPELDRLEIFLTPDEAIFFLDSERGVDAITALISKLEAWKATRDWEEHVTGPPRPAEHVYSWARPDEPLEISFLPTPGPGDSDGGDIF